MKHFYSKSVKYDLLNKFFYKNTKNFPKIKKIVLNLGCNTTKITNLAISALALELITSKKSQFTVTKKANLLFKIRKGNPVGCKVVLKSNNIFNFLEINSYYILPKLQHFNNLVIKNKLNKNSLQYKIPNLLTFTELEKNYSLFHELRNLDVTIITNSSKIKETKFLMRSFQFFNTFN